MTGPYSNLGLRYRERTAYKQSILERDKYTCQLCGQRGDFVDHMIPWAVSHDSSKGNLRAICRPCNMATRRKRKDAAPTLEQFYGYLEEELAKVSVRP